MPLYQITAPNGRTYQIEGPEGASQEDVARAVLSQSPEAGTPAPKPSLSKSFGRGVESMLSSGRTAVESLFGSPEEAAQKALQRQREASGKYPDTGGLDAVKRAYEERGVLGGAKEVAGQVPHAIAEQLPQLGTTLASGAAGARLGAMAGAPFGGPLGAGIGATIGGLAGVVLPSLVQQYGSNIERQAAEQQEKGEPLNISRTAAGAAAIPQAAFHAVETRFLLGSKWFGALIGRGTKEVTGMTLETAEKLAKDGLAKVLAKGTARGVAAEVPTEVLQQMLERAQAGLPIATPDAFVEYGDVAYQTTLLGPLGIPAQLQSRSEARREIPNIEGRMRRDEFGEMGATAPTTTPSDIKTEVAPFEPEIFEEGLTRQQRERDETLTTMARRMDELRPESDAYKEVEAEREKYLAKLAAQDAKKAEKSAFATEESDILGEFAPPAGTRAALTEEAPEEGPAAVTIPKKELIGLGISKNARVSGVATRVPLVDFISGIPLDSPQNVNTVVTHLSAHAANPMVAPEVKSNINQFVQKLVSSRVEGAPEEQLSFSLQPQVVPSTQAESAKPKVEAPRLRGRERQGNLFTKAEAPPAAMPEASVAETPVVKTPAEPTAPQQLGLLPELVLDKRIVDSLGIKGEGASKLRKGLIGVDVATPEGYAKLQDTLAQAKSLGPRAEVFFESLPPVTRAVPEPGVAGESVAGVGGESVGKPVLQPTPGGDGVVAPESAGVDAAVQPSGEPAAGAAAEPTALAAQPTALTPEDQEDQRDKAIEAIERAASTAAKASVAQEKLRKSQTVKAAWDKYAPEDVQWSDLDAESRALWAQLVNSGAAPRYLQKVANAAAPEKSPAPRGRGGRKRYSLSEPGEPTGNTIEVVSKALKRAFNPGSKFDRIVTVVQSVDQLPKEVQREGVRGAAHNGRAYMVADNIAPGEELGVFLHEAGAHLGFDRILGPDGRKHYANQVRSWAKGDDLKGRVAKEAMERSRNDNDELIAYTVEGLVNNGVKPSAASTEGNWLKRVMNAFRAALQKVGLRQELTPQDLVDLAYGAAHLEMQGVDTTRGAYKLGEDLEQRLFGQKLGPLGERTVAPMREGYNALREQFGLEPVTDWSRVPKERIAQAETQRTVSTPTEQGARFSVAPTGNPTLDRINQSRIDQVTREGDRPLMERLFGTLTSTTKLKEFAKKFAVDVVDNQYVVKDILSKAGQWTPLMHMAFASKAADIAATSLVTGPIALHTLGGGRGIQTFQVTSGKSMRDVYGAISDIAGMLRSGSVKERFATASAMFDNYAIAKRYEALPAKEKSMYKLAPDIFVAAREAERLYGAKLRQALADFTEYKNALLEANKVAGRFSDEDVRAWKEAADYVPWHRILDDAEYGHEVKTSARTFFNSLQAGGKMRELMGGDVDQRPIGSVLHNMQSLAFWLSTSAIKNHAANKVVNVLGTPAFGGRPVGSPTAPGVDKSRTVRVYKDGDLKFYELSDPLAAQAFMPLIEASGPILEFFSKATNMVRKGTTLMPGFVVNQLAQDSFRVATYSSVNSPFRAGSRVLGQFAKELSNDPLSKELQKYGLEGQVDYIFSGQFGERSRAVQHLIPMDPGIRKATNKVVEKLDRFAHASDMAQRRAVYEQTMEETGGDEALALYRAIEVINFQNRGASATASVLRKSIPFFNAYVQAQNVTYRAMFKGGISAGDRRAATQQFYMTGAKIAAFTLLYSMLVGDDDEYKSMSPNEQMRGWFIPGSREALKEFTGVDPGRNVSIPVPTDAAGLIFKRLPELTYNYITSQGTTSAVDERKLLRAVRDGVVNAIGPSTPIPQAVKPALELAVNYSFFTGRPIIGKGQENKESFQQFTETTSEFSKAIGVAANLSPIKLDYFIRGTFGMLGGTLLGVTSAVIGSASNVDAPTSRISDNPQFRAFFAGREGSGLREDYYDLREQIAKVNSTVNDLRLRSPERLQEYLEENKELYGLAKSGFTGSMDKAVEIFRQHRQAIIASDKSGDEKRRLLDELEKQEIQVFAQAGVPRLRRFAGM